MDIIKGEDFLKRWRELPDSLQDAVYDLKVDRVIDDLVSQNHFSDAQWDAIEHVILLVFLGFLDRRDVVPELEKELAVSASIASACYNVIDQILFAPLSREIDANFSHFNPHARENAVVPVVIAPQVNLKTPQSEGTVNLKKEPEGPKILAVGTSDGGGGFASAAPRSLAEQAPASSFGPAIIQKKQDVESAAHPIHSPMSSPTDKDIFALSPKDRWGIESENILTSRRMMGQSDVPPVSSVIKKQDLPPTPIASQQVSSTTTIEKRDDIVPAIEEPRFSESAPQTARPVMDKPQPPEEKKLTTSPSPAVSPQHAASLVSIVPPVVPPSSRQQETVVNKGQAPEPSSTMRPVASVNINTVSQNLSGQEDRAPQPFAPSAPAFRPAPVQPDPQARPMQWAVPAQPPKQPDVVVEIRQTQVNQAAPAGTYPNKPVENETIPVRPMKVSSPVQSVPPVAPTGSKEMLATHPISLSSSHQEPEVKKSLDPNEVVDIGPVIIHKRDDPSVAQMRSGAQYRDFSSGGFSKNFFEQPSHQNAASSVADVQVPVMPAGKAQTVTMSVDTRDQSPVPGYGKSTATPPPQKRGFFSFFKK